VQGQQRASDAKEIDAEACDPTAEVSIFEEERI
jgi:hypothetical protein